MECKVTVYQCSHCGKVTAGRMPKGGTGDFMYPRRHMFDGQDCPGNIEEAIWVDVPCQYDNLSTIRKVPSKIAIKLAEASFKRS